MRQDSFLWGIYCRGSVDFCTHMHKQGSNRGRPGFEILAIDQGVKTLDEMNRDRKPAPIFLKRFKP